MGASRKVLVVLGAAAAVLVVLWFALLGRGPEPLALVAEPQRDLLLEVEEPLALLEVAGEWLRRAGAPGLPGELPAPVAFLAGISRLAVAVDLPAGEGEPSFLAAVKAGRLAQLVGKVLLGREREMEDGLRVYRFGCTFAFQKGEDYRVGEADRLPELPAGRLRLLVHPCRIEQRLDLVVDRRLLGALRVPWPMREFAAGVDIDRRAVTCRARGEFPPARCGERVRRAMEGGPQAPLAAEYYDAASTILAVSWVAPVAADLGALFASEFWPQDALLQLRYRAEVGRFLREVLPRALGRRAALLVYRQGNRIGPGYPGVVLVFELREERGLEEDLRLLLGAVSRGVVGGERPPPADFPYFERREAAGGLPAHYLYYSDMMRPREGYQPVLALAGGRLVYASSPAVFRRLWEAPGLAGAEPAHLWLRYRNQGEESFRQLHALYRYLLEETLTARPKGVQLSDRTDYEEVFREVSGWLRALEGLEARVVFTSGGAFRLWAEARAAGKEE